MRESLLSYTNSLLLLRLAYWKELMQTPLPSSSSSSWGPLASSSYLLPLCRHFHSRVNKGGLSPAKARTRLNHSGSSQDYQLWPDFFFLPFLWLGWHPSSSKERSHLFLHHHHQWHQQQLEWNSTTHRKEGRKKGGKERKERLVCMDWVCTEEGRGRWTDAKCAGCCCCWKSHIRTHADKRSIRQTRLSPPRPPPAY